MEIAIVSIVDKMHGSFRYQKSQQQRSEVKYTGSIALEQYGDQSFGLELNMGKAPGVGLSDQKISW